MKEYVGQELILCVVTTFQMESRGARLYLGSFAGASID